MVPTKPPQFQGRQKCSTVKVSNRKPLPYFTTETQLSVFPAIKSQSHESAIDVVQTSLDSRGKILTENINKHRKRWSQKPVVLKYFTAASSRGTIHLGPLVVSRFCRLRMRLASLRFGLVKRGVICFGHKYTLATNVEVK